MEKARRVLFYFPFFFLAAFLRTNRFVTFLGGIFLVVFFLVKEFSFRKPLTIRILGNCSVCNIQSGIRHSTV